ncbi:hypothetical protein M885DRAFT_515804 [Pelagophyceae sp. CCMP2097]|nr:hypothetical protein M885DRAFT_515804 [Pelagophyceae sp. CCMP2097]
MGKHQTGRFRPCAGPSSRLQESNSLRSRLRPVLKERLHCKGPSSSAVPRRFRGKRVRHHVGNPSFPRTQLDQQTSWRQVLCSGDHPFPTPFENGDIPFPRRALIGASRQGRLSGASPPSLQMDCGKGHSLRSRAFLDGRSLTLHKARWVGQIGPVQRPEYGPSTDGCWPRKAKKWTGSLLRPSTRKRPRAWGDLEHVLEESPSRKQPHLRPSPDCAWREPDLESPFSRTSSTFETAQSDSWAVFSDGPLKRRLAGPLTRFGGR